MSKKKRKSIKCKPKETSIQKKAQTTGNPNPSYITISADELERIKSVNSDELEKQVTERVKAALTGEDLVELKPSWFQKQLKTLFPSHFKEKSKPALQELFPYLLAPSQVVIKPDHAPLRSPA